MPSRRTVSMLEAGLVTFLWSSSFIFIKLGLEDIPPMTFAAYRYTMASAVLMAYVFARHRSYVMSLDRDKVLKYVFLGFCGYFIAQGMQFFGLYYLQAITVTFILNMTPLIVLFLGVVILGEKPGRRQLLGVGIALLGVMAFFSGEDLQIDQKMGVVLTFISGVGWAVYMVATRHIVRKDGENVVVMTAISMFSGAMMLLIGSLASDDICTISNSGILIIVW
ncbi:MAG TPA: DMT family transporter, partial [Candidatus Methanofastidiosa archaeon]|nr:DMT family transporter [Candidatus Methanofastidiosa archaeon]